MAAQDRIAQIAKRLVDIRDLNRLTHLTAERLTQEEDREALLRLTLVMDHNLDALEHLLGALTDEIAAG